ncbi:MAG TPA: VTT domain-containing protein [Terriglobia bacterium]|nr:VTT domain-containing protein [Terriglobia bacterium]
MDEILRFVLRHGYAVLGVWVFTEQFGFPISSVPALLAAGALAASGKLNLAGVIIIPILGSLLADFIWYEFGRYKGSLVLKLICRISLEPDSCVRNTENLFSRQGAKSLMVAKFVPGLSVAAPPLSGMLGMRIPRFLLFDGLGAGAYVAVFMALGYIFSRQLKDIAQIALGLGTGLMVLLVASLVLYIAWKYFQRQRFIRSLRVNRITPEELKERIDAGEEVTIIDLRHSVDFETDPTTIPGAFFLPSEEFEERYREIPSDRELVLFCT